MCIRLLREHKIQKKKPTKIKNNTIRQIVVGIINEKEMIRNILFGFF